jgi:hypothetical protein
MSSERWCDQIAPDEHFTRNLCIPRFIRTHQWQAAKAIEVNAAEENK